MPIRCINSCQFQDSDDIHTGLGSKLLSFAKLPYTLMCRNLSYNHLSGLIPRDQNFSRFPASRSVFNVKTCPIDLTGHLLQFSFAGVFLDLHYGIL